MIRLESSQRENYPQWCTPRGSPVSRLTCDATGERVRLYNADGSSRTWSDPLAALHWMSESSCEESPPVTRWVGHLSYDLGRLFERLPSTAIDDLHVPLFEFTSWDPCRPETHYEVAKPAVSSSPLVSTFSRRAYLQAVERAIEYVRAGDVFQVNLSQRFSMGLGEAPATIYDRIQRQSPAVFGALIESNEFALVCNSPELFLHVWHDPQIGRRRVRTRPIKGTRPAFAGADRDLLDSVKDQAELHMIVDLERNDLGRVCEYGTVRVTQPRSIEAHPTVYHGVSTIEGVLRTNVTFVDLLRATFPGGSITGAPKVRAMEIIEALEPVRRGPYCGAIGYIAADGSMMFNVAIRTMIVKNGMIHVPVGGGIVADSDPGAEYDETLVKARAMFDALETSLPDLTG